MESASAETFMTTGITDQQAQSYSQNVVFHLNIGAWRLISVFVLVPSV